MKRVTPLPQPAATTAPIGRTELALVLALFVVGAALRCAWPSRMAVEHFDEGVYASDIWFDDEYDFHYPSQHLYAPPLLPTAIWWTLTILGPSNLGAMVPSLVAGCLTVPLLWWIGRSWFGPPAGLAAAALCALSDAHIVFSRMALTDVLLCFWLLLAVHCIWLAYTRGSFVWGIVAGVFTGLAWWTKYSGWLPLAMGLSGLAAWWLVERRQEAGGRVQESEGRDQRSEIRGQKAADSERDARTSSAGASPLRQPLALDAAPISFSRLVGIWCITATVAFAVWSPWLVALQKHGGYATVSANHRGYLVHGLGGWWYSLIGQLENSVALESILTALGFGLAFGLSSAWRLWTPERSTCNAGALAAVNIRRIRLRALAWAAAHGIAFTGMIACGGAYLLSLTMVAAAAAAGAALLAGWLTRGQGTGGTLLAASLTVVWCAALIAAGHAYTPYPRLALPLHVGSWLCVAAISVWPDAGFIRDPRKRSPATPLSRAEFASIVLVAGFGVLLLTLFGGRLAPRTIPAWSARTDLENVASRVQAAVLADVRAGGRLIPADRFVVYTYAEPALLFQLRLAGVELVRPVSSLAFADRGADKPQLPAFLVIGPQAYGTAGFEQQLARARDRLQLVDTFEYAPSDVVLLDNREPAQRPPSKPEEERPKYRLELYRAR